MNKPPHLTLVGSEPNDAPEKAPTIAPKTPSDEALPPLTGHFELGLDGAFYGYIDIGEDRINCKLLTQKDPSILKLEEYLLQAPIGTGRSFRITDPPSD